jgi:hypothetical protein
MGDYLVPLIVASTVSVFSSIIVLLTPVLFSRLRGKLFQQIVCFISIGDIIGNVPYMFPYRPSTGTPGCDIEAFFNYGGYPMEWMWTTALAYLLYQIAVRGRVPKSMVPIHVICWGVPIVLALLTQAFSKFVKNETSEEVCRMNLTPIPLYYHLASYYGLFFLCLCIMMVLYVKIFLLESQNDPRVLKIPFRVAKQALTWYPLLMFIFWTPHMVTAFTLNSQTMYYAFLILKIYHGLAVSIIFFYQSVESRWLWYSNFIVPCLPGVAAFYCEWYWCGFHSVAHRSHRALKYVSTHRRTEFDLSSPVGPSRSSILSASSNPHYSSTTNPVTSLSLSQNIYVVDTSPLTPSMSTVPPRRDSESSLHRGQCNAQVTSSPIDEPIRSMSDWETRGSNLICIDDVLDMYHDVEEDVGTIVSKDRTSHKSFRLMSLFWNDSSADTRSIIENISSLRNSTVVEQRPDLEIGEARMTEVQMSHMAARTRGPSDADNFNIDNENNLNIHEDDRNSNHARNPLYDLSRNSP